MLQGVGDCHNTLFNHGKLRLHDFAPASGPGAADCGGVVIECVVQLHASTSSVPDAVGGYGSSGSGSDGRTTGEQLKSAIPGTAEHDSSRTGYGSSQGRGAGQGYESRSALPGSDERSTGQGSYGSSGHTSPTGYGGMSSERTGYGGTGSERRTTGEKLQAAIPGTAEHDRSRAAGLGGSPDYSGSPGYSSSQGYSGSGYGAGSGAEGQQGSGLTGRHGHHSHGHSGGQGQEYDTRSMQLHSRSRWLWWQPGHRKRQAPAWRLSSRQACGCCTCSLLLALSGRQRCLLHACAGFTALLLPRSAR